MNKAAEEKSALLQNLEKMDDLHLPVLRHPKDVLLRLSDVVPSYGGADSCAPLSFTLRRGDRLFLSGPNGCGKSSILKTILGEHDEYRGELQKASGLIFSSVPQDTSDLRGTLDDFAAEKGVSQSLFLAIAHKLGVDKSEFSRDISALSEGQRKKILLARSLCEPAHVYVWDEPLNYIDVFARMQIENMLLSTGAALLLVEHDQAFCSRIAAETVQMQRA